MEIDGLRTETILEKLFLGSVMSVLVAGAIGCAVAALLLFVFIVCCKASVTLCLYCWEMNSCRVRKKEKNKIRFPERRF